MTKPAAVEIAPEPEFMLAPDVGALFQIVDADGTVQDSHTYLVTGWMKRSLPPVPNPHATPMQRLLADILHDTCREFGPRQQKLEWCRREEATHVTGRGVCGCLQPADMIKVVGRAAISQADLDDLREQQAMFVGETLF